MLGGELVVELLAYLFIAILIIVTFFFVLTLMYSRKLDKRSQKEDDRAQEEWIKELNHKQD